MGSGNDEVNCGPKINENLVQWIWFHQFIKGENLRCDTGQNVKIVHPGHWNKCAGPDFTRAVLFIENNEILSGDVEVEVSLNNWFHHGHHENFRFAHVVLLVVWEDSRLDLDANSSNLKELSFPVLSISSHLNSDFSTILGLYKKSSGLEPTSFHSGRCKNQFSSFSIKSSEEILSSAGVSRIRAKSQRFLIWNQDHGNENSLFLGIMSALGNPENSWPMRYLAEKFIQNCHKEMESWIEAQALLLGLGGWITNNNISTDHACGQFFRNIWEYWWRMRGTVSDSVLPQNIWNMRNIRPLHHPQRRLALGAYLFMQEGLGEKIREKIWAHRKSDNFSTKLKSFREILQPPGNTFWNRYYYFSVDFPLPRPVSLLSKELLIDLLVNAILPWALTQVPAGGKLSSNESEFHVIKLLKSLPQSAENSRTRHLRERIFGEPNSGPKGKAIIQQGLLQIEMEFCRLSNPLCSSCPMPTHLAGLANQKNY